MQLKHHAADLGMVIAWVHEACHLNSPQLRDSSVLGMQRMRDTLQSSQPLSSVLLSIGEAAGDILKDLDKKYLLSNQARRQRNCSSLFLSLRYRLASTVNLRKHLFRLSCRFLVASPIWRE